MTVKSNIEQFKTKACKIHKNLYDYSLVQYTGTHTPVSIICKDHGVFNQCPYSHLQGHGCPACATKLKTKNRTMTTDQFKVQAVTVHGTKYDYTNTIYTGSLKPLTIHCNIHGTFTQRASGHLCGNGCFKCGKQYQKGKYDDDFFKNNPTKKDIPAILYLVQLNDNGSNYYKIGITARNLTKRFNGKLRKLTVVITQNTTLYHAYMLEQQILSNLIQHSYHPKVKFSGHTECLNINDEVLCYIQNKVNEPQ